MARNIYIQSATIPILCAAFALMLLGCKGNYTYVPVQVTLLDAETNQPIPDIQIDIGYSGWMTGGPFITPATSQSVTNQNGVALLFFAHSQYPDLSIHTDEYIEHDVGFHQNPRRVFDHHPPDKPAYMTVLMWKAPLPIDVEVPAHYRGWLTVQIDEQLPRIDTPHFQRFKTVAVDGQAIIPPARVLEVFDIAHRAHYPNGQDIPSPAEKAAEIRHWWFPRTDPYYSVGFIGTIEEVEAIRDVLYPDDRYSREGFQEYSKLVRSRIVPQPVPPLKLD